MIHFMHQQLLQSMPVLVQDNCPEADKGASTVRTLCTCDLCTPPQCYCIDCKVEREVHQEKTPEV